MPPTHRQPPQGCGVCPRQRAGVRRWAADWSFRREGGALPLRLSRSALVPLIFHKNLREAPSFSRGE